MVLPQAVRMGVAPLTNRTIAITKNTALGTVIGWLIVALLVFWGFGFVLGTLRWLLRSFLMFLILGGLVVAYLALKDPPKVE